MIETMNQQEEIQPNTEKTTQREIKDLYEFEISRFQSLITENRDYAYSRYGLTMLYSVPPEVSYEELKKLGFENDESIDTYNQGTLKCKEGNIQEALELFQRSETQGCELPELFYNMALAYQESENNEKAKEYFEKYIGQVEKFDLIPAKMQKELDEIREHVKSM